MKTKSVEMINLVWLAINHFLVDLVSVYLVIGAYFFHDVGGRDFFILVLVYGITAFALQPVLGRLIDLSRKPYLYLLISNILILLASFFSYFLPILPAVIMAGLGNALFHVAAGSIGLNIEKEKAWPIGVLVGPGALGLFLGGWLAKDGWQINEYLVLVMLSMIILVSFLPRIEVDYHLKNETDRKNSSIFLLLAGLLAIVGLRSLVGFSLQYGWKSEIGLAVGLVLMVTFGKMLAGFIADRWGWRKMCLMMVGVSLPLLIFGFENPWLAMAGAFCFQITMPVTLTAVARVQPGYPGWAFGLPCFFLIVGAIIAFFTPSEWLTTNVGWMIAGQWLIIYFTLQYFNSLIKEENGKFN